MAELKGSDHGQSWSVRPTGAWALAGRDESNMVMYGGVGSSRWFSLWL